MLAQPIESFISGMGASVMTDGFIAIIAITFIAAIIAKRSDRAHGFTQYVPTLLTSLGILGTFCGIVAGLLGFDANNIDGSIGSLLEGMKTAFTTSLVGMSSSIIYKVLASSGMLTPKGDDIIDEDQIGILELYTVMKDQKDGINDIHVVMKEQASGMTLLHQAIGGENDSSLTSQIKLMRSDNNDQSKLAIQNDRHNHNELLASVALQQTAFESFQDKLWIKLQDFADMLSKSATETVIEALKQVIADFNKNLTEQFGENFKQLNAACKELVTWQDQYKGQLDDMGKKYSLGVESIGVTATAVGSITEHTAQIPAHMENLKDITEVNQHQIKELERHLEAFKDIRDKAVEAVPEIRSQIDATLEGVKTASDELAKGIKESSESMGSAIMQGTQEFVDNSAKVNGSLQATSDVMVAHNEKAITHYSDLEEGMNANYRDLSVRMQDEAKKIAEEYGKAGTQLVQELSQSKEAFDSGLETMRNQLNSTLESMVSRQSDEVNKIFNGLTTQIENALSSTGDAVDKQVGMIDKALEHEIEKVMTEMGSALASISRQFTNDYTQLVNAMQNIVESHNV
jgi:ABC-type transporter Mla subunit MlaD